MSDNEMKDKVIHAIVVSGSVVIVNLISGAVLKIPLVTSSGTAYYTKLAAVVSVGSMLVDLLKNKKVIPDNW